MKNKLVVLGLILACLISISFISCGGDQDPPEQLAGKYTLIEIKVENIGKTIILEPPNISGTLHLNSGGSWLMNMAAPDVELNETIDGTFWDADEEILTSGNGGQPTQTKYTLNENLLTFSVTANNLQVETTWQKL